MNPVEPIQHKGNWQNIVSWLQRRAGSHFAFLPGEEPPITTREDGNLDVRSGDGCQVARVGDWISDVDGKLVVTEERPCS